MKTLKLSSVTDVGWHTVLSRITSVMIGFGLACTPAIAQDFDRPHLPPVLTEPPGGLEGSCKARIKLPGSVSFEPVRPILDVVRKPITGSRDEPHAIKLQGREFRPEYGIDRDLAIAAEQAVANGTNRVYAIMQRDTFPKVEEWRTFKDKGLNWVSYLGERNWMMSIDLTESPDMNQAFELFQAKAMVLPGYEDRLSKRLLDRRYHDWAFDEESGLLNVVVKFFPDVDPERIPDLLEPFNQSREVSIEGTHVGGIQIKPDKLDALLELAQIRFVQQGPIPLLPLMDRTREVVNTGTVHGIDTGPILPVYNGLSGKNVITSNHEGMGGGIHEDFQNHDALGNAIGPRCLSGCNGGSHGVMTAGIMLGNGWLSAANGFDPFAKRGMAPEALFRSYNLDNHVDNYSFVGSYGDYDWSIEDKDRKVRGGHSSGRFRYTHVSAVANQGVNAQYGVEIGYYSVYNPAKNEIVVANLRSGDTFWNGSSMGPTFDGRIKPDMGAPGSYGSFPRDRSSLRVDIDEITLIADGTTRVWDFDGTGSNWHNGWTDIPGGGSFSKHGIQSVTQMTEGSDTFMRLVLNAPPWGSAFHNRPYIGLGTEADGVTALSVDGGPGDFVIIRYRYESEPFYDNALFTWNWFTDWAPGAPVWNSQGWESGVVSAADDNWHTMVIPMSNISNWNGEEMDYLAIRFSAPSMYTVSNPDGYGGASGSSAAAPVVAGTVAMLTEQMADEFSVNIDSYASSPFWLPGPGVGSPLPSTYKAVLLHTATDLIGTPEIGDPTIADTGQQLTYHAGPDLATGYGILNVTEAVDFVQMEADIYAGTPTRIVENEINSGDGQQYDVIVPFGCTDPLKITLVWDDYEGDSSSADIIPKLVNNLDLVLQEPNGTLHFPWSIDQPYYPTDPSNYPGAVEPEPITAADITPARRDQPNSRDNVEQILVDAPTFGVWKLWVLGSGMGAPDQNYSIAIGSP